MVRLYQKIQWVAFILILMMGTVGCEMLGSNSVSPTAPTDVSPGPAQLANFWVGRGQDKFDITLEGTGAFTVNVLAGSYLLEYVTDLGTFYIVFKADTSVSLTIGLQPGDNVSEVTVQQGTITVSDDQALATQEQVLIFAWPADPVLWGFVFDVDLSVELIILLEGGGIPGWTETAEEGKCTITTQVVGGGTIKPAGPITKPCGSSHSFKFKPGPPALTDVTVNGVSVIDQVQILGNGDGHLVIHKIDGDILLTGIW